MGAEKGKESFLPSEYEEFYRKLIEIQRKDSLYSITPGIIHDLNNVISIIVGYIELAKMQSLNEPSKLPSTLEIIEKASLRASQLLSNVLGYAKGGRGHRKRVDLNELVKELKNLIEKVFEKNIVIETRLSPDPQFVEAEPQELFQVLLNLCLNARDAMPDGGKLTIETSVVYTDNYVLLSISDTGVGMDEDTKKKIFTPFFTTKPQGSGLGLSVVWSIVKNLGGHVEVESSKGKGTKFKISLPPSVPKEEPKGEELEKEMRGFEKIMVVDDEEDIRNVTKEILEHYGYQVFLAKDGKEAVDSFREKSEEIDLVVLDLTLPYMKGEDVMRRIMEMRPDTRVIVSSGSPDEERMKMLIKLGAKAFIKKPYPFEKLLRLIREVLDKYKLENRRG